VRSYFRRSGDGRFRIQLLIPNVEDLEFLVTDTEKETLIKWIAAALMRTPQSFHKPYHERSGFSPASSL
jgi:excinuclease UvrABC nuclease subunit